MAINDPSIADVLKGAVRDAQELVRCEIALAKAEAREEISRIGTGAALLVVGAVVAVIGVGLLMTTLAFAISELAAWPVWAGFAVVTFVTLLVAGFLTMLGRSRMTAERRMPLTVDTLKENMEWMRARTS